MSKSTFSWKDMESKLGQKKEYPFIANSYVVSFGSVVTSFSKISGIDVFEIFSINKSVSIKSYPNSSARILPIVDFPQAGSPINTMLLLIVFN